MVGRRRRLTVLAINMVYTPGNNLQMVVGFSGALAEFNTLEYGVKQYINK